MRIPSIARGHGRYNRQVSENAGFSPGRAARPLILRCALRICSGLGEARRPAWVIDIAWFSIYNENAEAVRMRRKKISARDKVRRLA